MYRTTKEYLLLFFILLSLSMIKAYDYDNDDDLDDDEYSYEDYKDIFLRKIQAQIEYPKYPDNYKTYIRNMNTEMKIRIDNIYREDIDNFISENNFPAGINTQLKSIVYSSSGSGYINVSHKEYATTGYLEEVLGVVLPINSGILFAYIRGFTSADLIPQRYDTVSYEDCSRILIIKSCSTKTEKIPLCPTPAELVIINQALAEKTAIEFGKKIIDLRSYELTFTQGDIIYSLDGRSNVQIKDGILSVNDMTSNGIYTFGTRQPSSDMHYSFQVRKNNRAYIVRDWDGWEIASTSLSFYGVKPYKFIVTDDYNFLIVDSLWHVLYEINPAKKYQKYQMVLPQDYKLFSPNRQYYVSVESNGKFVIAKYGTRGPTYLYEERFINDIVIYNKHPNQPYFLAINNYGHLVIFDKDSRNNLMEKGNTLSSSDAPFSMRLTNDLQIQILKKDGQVGSTISFLIN